MRGLAKPLKRCLILGHRWLGIGTGVFFATWVLSGLVMMSVPFPSLTEAARLAGLPPSPGTGCGSGPTRRSCPSGCRTCPRTSPSASAATRRSTGSPWRRASSDRSSDALEPGGAWNPYVRAIAGFMSGVGPEDISAADDLTYDDASTGKNWNLPLGRNEKVFQEIGPDTAFGPDTHA